MHGLRLASVLAMSSALGGFAQQAGSAATGPGTAPPGYKPSPVAAEGTQKQAGRFAWADLFTGDPAAATRFYTQVFGWTAEEKHWNQRTYFVLGNAGHPVANVIRRRVLKPERPARWVDYLSVDNLDASLSGVESSGGKILAPKWAVPDRGSVAIVSDSQGSVIGLIQPATVESTSRGAGSGDWCWFSLYARDPAAAGRFYQAAIGYEVKPEEEPEGPPGTTMRSTGDYLLSMGDRPQAEIEPLPGDSSVQPAWFGFVCVTDIDGAISRASSLGGTVILSPEPSGAHSRSAIVADPTGGLVGLVQFGPGGDKP